MTSQFRGKWGGLIRVKYCVANSTSFNPESRILQFSAYALAIFTEHTALTVLGECQEVI